MRTGGAAGLIAGPLLLGAGIAIYILSPKHTVAIAPTVPTP